MRRILWAVAAASLWFTPTEAQPAVDPLRPGPARPGMPPVNGALIPGAEIPGQRPARPWDVATHKEKAALTGHTSFVRSVAFSPDGKTVASASWDKTILLWDVPPAK